jgi:hypothetical protein
MHSENTVISILLSRSCVYNIRDVVKIVFFSVYIIYFSLKRHIHFIYLALRIPRRRWVDNIKMDLREMGWDGLIWLRIRTSGGLL